MNTFTYTSDTVETTQALAKNLAQHLEPGDIICLSGDLGTGKTTFVKGLAAGLKINPGDVHSPTFVFLNIYEGRCPVYHFDLYRIEREHDIYALGYDEFFYGEGVAVVEWADRLGDLRPQECLTIELSHQGQDRRNLTLTASGQRYANLLTTVAGAMTPNKKEQANS